MNVWNVCAYSCRIIVCGMRQLDPKDTENLAEIAWRYKDKGVAGFDLAGPEYGFRSKTHKVPRCTPTPPRVSPER